MPKLFGTTFIKAKTSKIWGAADLARLASAKDYQEAAKLRDGIDRTLLHVAAEAGNLNALRGLLHEGANVNAADLLGETPLIHAARAGRLESVRILMAAGADLNAHHLEGWNALAAAVIRGHEAVVELLLTQKQNLDPEILSPGMTPVRMAVQIGNVSILRHLLKAGAQFNLRGFDGKTPLELAQSLNNSDCERTLRDWIRTT